MIFYCGCYTDQNHPKGIIQGKLDPHSGEIFILDQFDAGMNPSYLFQDSRKDLLYAVNEVGGEGVKGRIHCMKIGDKAGLKILDDREIAGSGPCYGMLMPSAPMIITANYGSGSLSQIGLSHEGLPVKSSLHKQFYGKGDHAQRQEGPHPHSLMVYDRELYAADLGLDRIHLFQITSEGVPLKEAAEILFPRGSGPRMMVTDRNDHLYVVEELSNSLSCWTRIDDQWGCIQRISTVPRGWEGENLPAHILINRKANRIYLSNRGHNSLAVYDVDQETGLLSLMEHVMLKADFPRFFAMSYSEHMLLAAGQNNGLLESFQIDERGIPRATGFTAQVHAPSCILFLQA